MNRKYIFLSFLIVATLFSSCKSNKQVEEVLNPVGPAFIADSAMAYCQAQCDFGPRTMNSKAHDLCEEWIVNKFKGFGLEVETQKADLTGWDGTKLHSTNIIAHFNPQAERRILICAHWDSRPWADNDPDSTNWHKPVLAANDGASGVGVMLEVARLLQNDTTLAIGVDLGMKRLFVTSEGKSFVDKSYLKKRRKLRYLKRCLQSKGTHSAKRHLTKLSHKERNLSKDMVERSTNALLKSTDASILVLEDLSKIKVKTSKAKEGFKKMRHNNALSQVPFYLFKERLTHKATLVGKQVVSVSPAFTSQTDSRTNKRDGIRKGCNYVCSDGIVLDADWNAAVNIALRGNHPLSSSELPLSGRVRSITQSSEV